MTARPNAEPAERDDAGLRGELRDLTERLREAEETISAIATGDVDAVVVQGPTGPQVYTLENDDRPYRRLIEQVGESALTLTPDGLILYCNRRMAELLQMPLEKLLGQKLQSVVFDGDKQELAKLLARGTGRRELTLMTAKGTPIPVHLALTEFTDSTQRTLCGIMADITEQKQTEMTLRETHARLLAESAARERAESLLRQAQKMEAVGQLTGGIAHDFNNLLTTIIGGLEMIERQWPAALPGAPVSRAERGIALAKKGANRAALLTQQLLVFSRRQALNPRAIDVNALLSRMFDMLRRTLGESVVVIPKLSKCAWGVRADPNQLENAILNLAVNARDAMPNGGRLTIATGNRFVADTDLLDVDPGEYLVIAVTDSGTGMDQATLEHAFEPFFTTKGVGHGTGLGLSQVYGFAKQSQGHVTLQSEPGNGTTVEVYLPRQVQDMAQDDDSNDLRGDTPMSRAGETVLVVEDNDAVRAYSVEALRELGYVVIEASEGGTALEILDRKPEIRLLFTDIGLPGGLTGRQLAHRAASLRAGLKVLLTTGYEQNLHHAEPPLDPNVHVLVKPFTFRDLALGIRRALEAS